MRWKRYNKIQLTKYQIDLINLKNKNHPPCLIYKNNIKLS